MMDGERPIRKKPRISGAITHRICPHCDKQLNLKTYHAHRRLYFDSQSKSWLKDSVPPKKFKKAASFLPQEEIIDPPDIFDNETSTETDSMDIDVLLECDQQEDHIAASNSVQTDHDPVPTPHSHHMTTSTSTESDIEPQTGTT